MNATDARHARNDARKALDEAERAFANNPTDERWSDVQRARDAFERADTIARVIAPEVPDAVSCSPRRREHPAQ